MKLKIWKPGEGWRDWFRETLKKKEEKKAEIIKLTNFKEFDLLLV